MFDGIDKIAKDFGLDELVKAVELIIEPLEHKKVLQQLKEAAKKDVERTWWRYTARFPRKKKKKLRKYTLTLNLP